MDKRKRARLEAKGWTVGSAKEFLGLSDAEDRFIETKLELSRALAERRRELGYTQEQVARKLGSSQSRVAKMEAGDSSVSIDLLLRALFTLQATRRDVARAILASPRTARGG